MNYDKLLQDLFKAYYECRKNKRKTINQIQFEMDYELNLINLADEIYNGTYKIGKSIAFIVDKPVKREIFAGDFRDRIVHHYVINQINHIFEKQFIYDSYSCRVGKGTLFGVKRIEKFIRSCSENYQKDCYILKLDIKGFFMSIDKDILFEKIEKTIIKNLSPLGGKYPKGDRGILNLIKKIIYNNPTKNCIIKGKKSDWVGLPKSKSLFFALDNTGLPIGNLTSQVFANLYLDSFDKFVKNELLKQVPLIKGVAGKAGGLFYGRYVDDFIIVHESKDFLKSLIPKINNYLKNELKLELHPKKIYLQYYTHGVSYLGAFIKPFRIYTGKRTKGNFYQKIQILNQKIRENKAKADKTIKDEFRATINSYLGFLKHHKSYKLRKNFYLT